MTIKKMIREASFALVCAILAFSMVFQLTLGAAASTVHAAKQAQAIDRLGVFCASSDERNSQNESVPKAVHHGEELSACCTWGGRDLQSAAQFLPPMAILFGTFDGDIQSTGLAQPLAASTQKSRGLRPQAQRAPPNLI
jgi:hypothetical protein